MQELKETLEGAGIGVEIITQGEIQYLLCNNVWKVFPEISTVRNTMTNMEFKYEDTTELINIIKG